MYLDRMKRNGSLLAQLAERETVNLEAAGSTPAQRVLPCRCHNFCEILYSPIPPLVSVVDVMSMLVVTFINSYS